MLLYEPFYWEYTVLRHTMVDYMGILEYNYRVLLATHGYKDVGRDFQAHTYNYKIQIRDSHLPYEAYMSFQYVDNAYTLLLTENVCNININFLYYFTFCVQENKLWFQGLQELKKIYIMILRCNAHGVHHRTLQTYSHSHCSFYETCVLILQHNLCFRLFEEKHVEYNGIQGCQEE